MTDTLVHDGLLCGGKPISRRAFVRVVGAAVAGSALLAAGIDRLGGTSMTWAAAPALLRATFAPYVGDSFHVRLAASDTLALQLVKARDLRSAPALAARGRAIDPEQNFSILFRGPLDRPLLQDTYHFEHARAGEFTLLLVPMRPGEDGRYYEAIFNRLRAESAL